MKPSRQTGPVRGQLDLPLPARVPRGRGGWRPGAGRPRKQGQRNAEHARRPFLDRRTPVHVTLRCSREAGRLRRRAGYRAVRAALAVSVKRLERFRVVHVSIQASHLHLLVEATDRRELSRGMQSFSISCARQLNQRLGRRGRVFADRYHARALRTPREVRHALSYVLNNWRHHGEHEGSATPFDPYSSARAFGGWTVPCRARITTESELLPTAVPRSWLLAIGWKMTEGSRRGNLRLISPSETPGGPDPRWVRNKM